MTNHGQSVHRFAADQHIQLDEVGFAVAREVIVERSVAARNAFQAVVKIEHDFVQRQFVGEHDARCDKYSNPFCVPRLSWQSCRIPPTDSSLVMIIALMMGSSILLMSLGLGNFAGLSTSITLPSVRVMR